jgi:hypothetical protein
MEIFSKKRYLILIGVLLFLTVPLYFWFNPSGQLIFPKCPIYQYLGVYCSGCGSQRAIHDLLHLNFLEAISHNVLLVPAIILILIEFCMRYFYPKKKSLLYYRKAPFIVLIVIVIFTILRNIKEYPFNYLAP